MIAIAMFNNKGGVGKTTLTCNIVSLFAKVYRRRVLVVDCDPQCNSTQLIMGEDYATELYWNAEGHQETTTIRTLLQPIEDGDSTINTDISPILSSHNRFGVDLLPGHPGFSVIEDRLGAAWHDLLGGDIGGIRKTNWNTAFCRSLAARYDIVFYDLGPSLGSINRSVLIGCDKFLTPMGADIFSILGLKNIASWIEQWMQLYSNSISLADERTPKRLAEYAIKRTLDIANGYIGYTMQQYITKSKQGVRRPTKAYEAIINSVPEVVHDSLGDLFSAGMAPLDAKLGDVPHLYSLIPLAQAVAAPILDLQASDGLVGAQYKQREEYDGIIETICGNIRKNLGMQE
jgi:cellulose biosynthesis protein BcsQ